jgi:hypothetical protein
MTINIPEIAIRKTFYGGRTRLIVQQGQISYFCSRTQFFDRNVVDIDLNMSLFFENKVVKRY